MPVYDYQMTISSLATALRQWKCPGCGGSGQYQQDKAGRTRNAEQGRPNNPRYQPDAVTCKVCGGDGLHPIASKALSSNPE